MLDRLLGRADLRDRIADLEDEVDSLEAQLEAESERRAEAVTAKQAAQERVNQLEDRIEELEDRLERAEEGDSGPTFAARTDLRGDRVDELLDRLRSFETDGGTLTAYVEDGLPGRVADRLGERAPLGRRAAPCLLCVDDLGLVSVGLRPPFPPAEFVEEGDQFTLDRGWFRPPDRFAVALVRADVFAYGVYEGEERVDFRGFESDVKGSHSKGGFSQDRFERRREEQIESHLDRCREALDERDVEPLYVVGDERLVAEFEDRAAVTAVVDASGDPRSALAAAVDDLLSVRLFVL